MPSELLQNQFNQPAAMHKWSQVEFRNNFNIAMLQLLQFRKKYQ